MEGQISFSIKDDGSIIISGKDGDNIILDPGSSEEARGELMQLGNIFISFLLQAFDMHGKGVSEQVKHLLQDVAHQKNIVKGSLTNVKTVRIGDETRYYFHPPGPKLPKDLTSSIPKVNPNELIGREDDLEELHGLLSRDDRVVVVNGLGGVGKTTLAQAYVGKYYDEYSHIAWVTQTSESIVNDVVNTEGLIRMLKVDTAGLQAEQLFSEIVTKLKSIDEKPNLLVIDNAEQSLSGYRHRLPGSPNWRVLVTSREELEEFHTKRLDFLEEEKALQLFKKHYTLGKLHDEEIRELVKTVDYHTLTIEVLAKTAKVQRYTSAKLKQAIDQDLRANVKVGRQEERVEKIGSYLASVFNLSRLNDGELWVMKQFICLPSEFHTFDLIYELTVSEESPYRDLFAEMIFSLTQKGWLLHNQKDSYKMHRIIADVVKKQPEISIENVKWLIKAITKRLNIDQIKDNPIEKFSWIPFGESILKHFQDVNSEEVSVLQHNLAQVLLELGDYEKAKLLLQKAVQISERNFGPEHSNTARIYSSLAVILRYLGDYKGARILHEKAVKSYEKNFGLEHSYTARSYSNLALVLKDLGDYAGAKDLLEKAVQSNEKNFGPEHPDTARSYSNLALVLQELGNYAGAKDLLEKAVKSYERTLGPEHPYTATRYSNLALVLYALLDYAGARDLLEKAVQSNERNFGFEHPSTVANYSNLAMVLKGLGDHTGARDLLEKAVQSDEKNFGPEHPDTAVSYSNLATVLQALEDYTGARDLLEKAVQSNERNFGMEHPSTAKSYSNLAVVLKDLGQYKEALKLSERALNIFRKAFPEGHPYIQIVSDNCESIKKLSLE
ncbi:MAG TPA: tetratricopeptide repeat protein [Flavisolibacter sp.]